MEKRTAIAGVTLLLTGLVTFSCSWKRPSTELQWKDTKGALRSWVRKSSRDYQCYFVTITGSGITPDYGPGDLGTRDPVCMKLGINSTTVSMDTIENRGISFRIPSGSARRIRVLGVETSEADCSGQTVKELFDRRPAIFELGVATENTFVDRRIEVNESITGARPQDIVQPCDTPETPLPSNVTDTRLVALFGNLIATSLRVFKRGAGGALEEDTTIAITGGVPQKLAAPPSFRSFFAFTPDGSSTFLQRVDISSSNELVTSMDVNQGYQFSPGVGALDLGFSSASNATHLRLPDKYHSYGISLPPTAFLSNPCVFAHTGMFAIGNYHYNISTNLIFRQVSTTNGAHCGTAPSTPVDLGEGVEFLEYQRGANVAANGVPNETGVNVAEGIISPQEIQVDALGKSLFLRHNTNDLFHYAIGENGDLTRVIGAESSVAGQALDILAIPLF